MTELLPCPFCGTEPFLVSERPVGSYAACAGCGVEGPTGDFTDKQAIAAWNTRATAAPVVVGEDAVTEVIEAAKPFLADPNPQLGGGYLMNILVQASATRRLKAACERLTAALAGD